MSLNQWSGIKSQLYHLLTMCSRRKLCRGGLMTIVWICLALILSYYVFYNPQLFRHKSNHGESTVANSQEQSNLYNFKSHLIKMRSFLSKISNSTSDGRNGKVDEFEHADYVEERQMLERFGDMFVDIAKYVERSGGQRGEEEGVDRQMGRSPEKGVYGKTGLDLEKTGDADIDQVERQKQNIREWDQVYENFEDSHQTGGAEDNLKMLEKLIDNWDPFYMTFPSEQAQDRVLINFKLPARVAEELNQEMLKMGSSRPKFSRPDPVQLNVYPDSDTSWKLWQNHITQYEIYNPDDPAFKQVLTEMKTSPIEDAYQPSGGTQQKLVFYLATGLRVIFKPMRFPRKQEALPDHMFWRDYERHIAEIAAFTLDRVLGFHRVPPVVGRHINVTHDVKRFADLELQKTFFKSPAGNICFYGTCQYYCDTAHAVCGRPEILEGSLMAYLPSSQYEVRTSWRHPWRRSYSKHHQKAEWQEQHDYCHSVRTKSPYNSGRRLLDLMDMAVFDFLAGNMDRHHYETFHKFDKDRNFSSPVVFDNGRGFGKSGHDELTILAPLYQCCLVRFSTLQKLLSFGGGAPLSEVMRGALAGDLAAPVLLDTHLRALDRRLDILLLTIHTCVRERGFSEVVMDDGL